MAKVDYNQNVIDLLNRSGKDPDEKADESTIAGVVRGILMAVDAKIEAALEKDKEQDKTDMDAMHAALMSECKQMINEAITASLKPLADMLSKPKKRTGEVHLPSGKVKMMISEE